MIAAKYSEIVVFTPLPVVAAVRTPVRRGAEPVVRAVLHVSDSLEHVHDVSGERRERGHDVPGASGPLGELPVRRPVHARGAREGGLVPALLLHQLVELLRPLHHRSLISR